jgi:Transposase DNA-binding
MLLAPREWAQNEFGFAQLGDKRRNQRLVNIAQNLAIHPGGTLPQAFPDWAELKAAYRFFDQAGVNFQQIQAPHVERTRASCRQPGEHLIIEDTTLLDYSTHEAAEDLGQIGVLSCTVLWLCGWRVGR